MFHIPLLPSLGQSLSQGSEVAAYKCRIRVESAGLGLHLMFKPCGGGSATAIRVFGDLDQGTDLIAVRLIWFWKPRPRTKESQDKEPCIIGQYSVWPAGTRQKETYMYIYIYFYVYISQSSKGPLRAWDP